MDYLFFWHEKCSILPRFVKSFSSNVVRYSELFVFAVTFLAVVYRYVFRYLDLHPFEMISLFGVVYVARYSVFFSCCLNTFPKINRSKGNLTPF